MEATTNNYISKRAIPFRNIIELNIVLSWHFTALISHANPSKKAIESDLKNFQNFTSVCMRRT